MLRASSVLGSTFQVLVQQWQVSPEQAREMNFFGVTKWGVLALCVESEYGKHF